MILSINSSFTLSFVKSLVLALIFTLSITPIIFFLTSANISWILMASSLWALGSILIFHPFVFYVYPHLMSKMGVYLLTSILIIVSVWFNVSMITLFLPYDYLYYTLFNATLTQITLWGSIYIIMVNAILTNFILISNVDFYKEESLF
ncbi:MAG: Unknown protein [uncultured Sulfurovum sp.]|uniref:Uncharacterized protein n=1 Tax=uncultured Sulfurovum sp. TaxID=269237 RepID=A0A6S6SZG7_9BACT|nr:MAG: Unknown protein [uncultured Sulfurovum sp.]